MSELSLILDEMVTCGENMIKAANQLKEIFSGVEQIVPNHGSNHVPKKEEKTYTKEEVRGILAGKSAKGHGKEVKALLTKYGADKLSALSPEHYAAIVADAEAIGNE